MNGEWYPRHFFLELMGTILTSPRLAFIQLQRRRGQRNRNTEIDV